MIKYALCTTNPHLQALISLFADDDGEVVAAAWKGVEALTTLIPKESAAEYVRCIKEAVATAKV
jgi:hypothetical protein